MSSNNKGLLKDHPRKTHFTTEDLRKYYKVTPAVMASVLRQGLLDSRTYSRDDLDQIGIDKIGKKINATKVFTVREIASMVSLSPATVRNILNKMNIEPVFKQEIHSSFRGEKFFYDEASYQDFIDSDALSKARSRRQVRKSIPEVSSTVAQAKESENIEVNRYIEQANVDIEAYRARQSEISQGIKVSVRQRGAENNDHRVVLHLGPTNSGKTYHAVEGLIEAWKTNPEGLYVYAGPLRMLAYEVMEKIGDRIGYENVGLLTGEEQLNSEVSVLCCTAEMAPDSGDVLIVDEAHWAADMDRGRHWTNLMIASDYRTTYILGPSECEKVFRSAYTDISDITVHHHQRKVALSYGGSLRDIYAIPSRSALVAFSRKNVQYLTERLREDGRRVVSLYGAMPIDVRKDQIDKFVNGDAEIIVTTDVIGHGINLPLDNVVFAETDKYDGVKIRNLHGWEAAQICGRAGRFGLSDLGTVYTVKNVHVWDRELESDPKLVQDAVNIARGKSPSNLSDIKFTISPTLSSLGLKENEQHHLADTVEAWTREARAMYADSDMIQISPMTDTIENINTISRLLRCQQGDRSIDVIHATRYEDMRVSTDWSMSIEDAWTLARGPFQSDSPALLGGARWLHSESKSALLKTYRESVEAESDSLTDLEQSCKAISEFRSLAVVLGAEDHSLPCGITREDMIVTEKILSNELIALMEFMEEELRQAVMNRSSNKRKKRSKKDKSTRISGKRDK